MYKTILTLINLVFFASTILGGNIEKEFDIAMGKKLTIDIRPGGSVYIEGWDKEKIQVKVEYRGKDLDSDIIEFKKHKNGLDIDVGYDHYNNSSNFRFKIKVPKRFDIEVETMGGDIEISNVKGEFSGKTMGGDLRLNKLKGEIHLTTMGGDITLNDSELDGALKTMGGDISFENVGGNVKGSTMGGDVTYKNVSGKEVESEVNISTMGGEISVDEAQGGADVQTMGGEIYIKKAKKFIKAKTMGGDIQIDEIDGWVKATTMGGEITVVMTGDPDKGKRDVDISSMGGDIELTLPEGLSIEFDVCLTYTKNSPQNFKIESDFSINIEESKEWEYKHGSPRKHITGTGEIKGGKNRIHIKTINGNIRIKKGK